MVESKSNGLKINRSIEKSFLFFVFFPPQCDNANFMRVGELLNVGKRSCMVGEKENVFVSQGCHNE